MLLTAQRSSMSSPWSSLTTAFAQRSTRIATLVHVISSIYVLFLHVLNEYSYSLTDPKLSLFVKSRYEFHFPCAQKFINNPATQQAPSLFEWPPTLSGSNSVIYRLVFRVPWSIDGSICLPMGNSGMPGYSSTHYDY